MLKIYFSVGICCFFVVSVALGQPLTVTGRVLSPGGPVPSASVILQPSSSGGATDNRGVYAIDHVTAGTYVLQVFFLGFKPVERSISITSSTTIIPDIMLEEIDTQLEEVTVTGVSKATALKENPVSVVLISARAIQRSAESNIIDVLVRNVPGLNAVKTGPNISKPFIRGLGYNRVLTLYDGVRQEGQQWGDEHGIEVDAYNIEKAEVIKGPASLMYGSDALAGVVSLFPFEPKENGIAGRLVSEFQSNNGLFGSGLRVAGMNKHWHWSLTSSYRIAKNYSNRIDGRVYNTGFNEKNASGKIGYTSRTGDSELSFSLYDNLQGIPDGSRDSLSRKFTKQISDGFSDDVKNRPIASDEELSGYELSPLHQHIEHYRLYTDHRYQVGKGDIRILLGYQQNKRREYNHPTDPNQPGLYVDLQTVNYGWQYNAPEISNIEVSVGMNGMYQNNRNKDATTFPIPDFSLLDIGSYAFVKWKRDDWTISGGFRYDIRRLTSDDYYLRQDPATGYFQHAQLPDTANAILQFPRLNQLFRGTSLSVGSTYQVLDQWSIKMNLSKGYRAPNISEIASNGLDPGAHIVYIGNRNFVPESNFQLDLGLNGTFKNVSASLSIFNNFVQHYIYLSQLVDDQGNPIELLQGNKTFQYQQASAHLYGIEATVDVHPANLEGLTISSDFSMVFGNNTGKEFEDSGIAGQYLPFIPPVKILNSIEREWKTRSNVIPVFNVRADVDIIAPQNRYLALYNTETRTAGYTLVNFSTGLDIQYTKSSRMQVLFQVNNLFNSAFQSNLSRLKYFEYYTHSPNGHLGMYDMGRNVCLKVSVPFNIKGI